MASAQKGSRRVTAALLAAPLLWLLLFFIVPVVFIATYTIGGPVVGYAPRADVVLTECAAGPQSFLG